MYVLEVGGTKNVRGISFRLRLANQFMKTNTSLWKKLRMIIIIIMVERKRTFVVNNSEQKIEYA